MKKALSLILALILLFSALSLTALSAYAEDADTENVGESLDAPVPEATQADPADTADPGDALDEQSTTVDDASASSPVPADGAEAQDDTDAAKEPADKAIAADKDDLADTGTDAELAETGDSFMDSSKIVWSYSGSVITRCSPYYTSTTYRYLYVPSSYVDSSGDLHIFNGVASEAFAHSAYNRLNVDAVMMGPYEDGSWTVGGDVLKGSTATAVSLNDRGKVYIGKRAFRNVSGNTTKDVKICPLGDVNQNGRVQANDAMMAYQHAQGKADSQITDEYVLRCADVAPIGSPNGKVQAADAMVIYQQAQGKHPLY